MLLLLVLHGRLATVLAGGRRAAVGGVVVARLLGRRGAVVALRRRRGAVMSLLRRRGAVVALWGIAVGLDGGC